MPAPQFAVSVGDHVFGIGALTTLENCPPAAGGALRVHSDVESSSRSQRSHGQYAGYRLIEFAERFFAVPAAAGPVYLADDAHRSNPWLLAATNLENLRNEIDRCTSLGIAPRQVEEFSGFQIYTSGGRFYAVRPECVAVFFSRAPGSEPGDFVEDSHAAIRRRLLGIEIPGDVLGTFGGFALTRLEGSVFAFPLDMQGARHLAETDRAAAGIINRGTRAEVERAICDLPPVRTVEFAGWLPIFQRYGACGTHPQFAHTDVPPAGYAFTQSATPRRGVEAVGGAEPIRRKGFAGRAARTCQVALAAARLFAGCVTAGVRPRETVDFLRTRSLASQLLLPPNRDLVFLTSVPFTFGQDPWVIEIEDVASLLYPYVENGRTANLKVEDQPGYRAVMHLLERPNCRGIITHVRATADGISKLFRSETISRKTTYIRMGIRTPTEWQRHQPSSTLNLLFLNSWHQEPNSFYLRGGLDVLEAFAMLHSSYPELRLTLRTRLPPDLAPRYRRIIEDTGVSVLDQFLPPDRMHELLLWNHIFLLPSARIHIMSVLQAMAYGLVPVVSDGWGMTEYVEQGRNGLVVGGRYGKVAWNDEQNGMLREHYAPMYHCDQQVTQNLVNELSQLADDAHLRQELGRNARHDAETRFTLAHWNVGLRRALDRAWTSS
jgi:glycosyltransferase involved in cell wall biosynthesis